MSPERSGAGGDRQCCGDRDARRRPWHRTAPHHQIGELVRLDLGQDDPVAHSAWRAEAAASAAAAVDPAPS
jgi:hypothetical protein